MIDKCKICENFIDDFNEVTTCWHCKVSVHNSCGKISKQTARLLKVHENCKWVCDVCLSKPIIDILTEKLNQILQSESSPFRDLPEILKRINHLSINVQHLNDKYDVELNSSLIFPGAKRSRSGIPVHENANASLNLDAIGFEMSFEAEGSMVLQEKDQWESNYRSQQEATQQFLQNQPSGSNQSDTTDNADSHPISVVSPHDTKTTSPQQIPQIINQLNSDNPSNPITKSPNSTHHKTNDTVQQQQQSILQPSQQQQQQIQQQAHSKRMERQQIQQKIVEIENVNQIQQQHMQHQERLYQQQLQYQQQQLLHQQSQSSNETTTDCLIQAARRVKYKFLYVSELHPATTCEQMADYISKKLNVPKNDIICKILLKKDCNLNDLEFVSFKIGIKEDLIDQTKTVNFWPPMVTARDFQERRRSGPRHLQTDN